MCNGKDLGREGSRAGSAKISYNRGKKQTGGESGAFN